jgi:hypothetical protein
VCAPNNNLPPLQADVVLVMDQDRLYNQLSTALKVCGAVWIRLLVVRWQLAHA